MTSFAAGAVKVMLRLVTFPYRLNQRSLSRNVKYVYAPYRVPEGFKYEVREYNGVKVEELTPSELRGAKTILHIHGGGAVGGMTAMYRKTSERYARISGLKVVSVDYEAGLRKVHPEILNECVAAYEGMLKAGYEAKKMILTGDSMGANLALAMCLKLRDEGKELPSAVISVCVQGDMSSQGDSYRKNAHADPMYALPFWQSYDKRGARLRRISPYCGDTPLDDPYLSPAFGNFEGFPPMLVMCGDIEMCESDSDMIYGKALAAGVKATQRKYRGMFHDFLYFAPRLKESREAWRHIAEFISKA